MPRTNVIAIGASAGGVASLVEMLGALPSTIQAVLCVVLHVPENAPSALPAILQRRTTLRVAHARDGDPLEVGSVLVAPPGSHLLVKRTNVRVVRGPHENGHRPAVDPLFRTAARACGQRAIGVVLSGTLDDGTSGLRDIKARGGTAIAQDPAEALFPGMPESAIENVQIDFVGPVAGIARELVRITEQLESDLGGPVMIDDLPEEEIDVVELDHGTARLEDWPSPSPFTCPQCHGALFEAPEGERSRYRCHTGHAFSDEALASMQAESLDTALWTALRALQENAALLRRLHERSASRGHARGATRFLEQAADVEHRANVIRQVLMNGPRSERAG